ncbi:MAG: nitrilase-related carbon-nitrogen hydrolase, partial [Nocardioidaceae bacterium]
MRISLAQMDSRLGDIDANVERAEHVVASAVAEGADLVVFPELYLSGYSLGSVDADLTMRPDDARIQKLAQAAGQTGLLVG